MSTNNVGSNGRVERAIWFFAGCIMGILGAGLAYAAYLMMQDGVLKDDEWLYVTGYLGLAFFLLRGAWYTIIPEKQEEEIKMSHDR